ncbi:hypothetical protein J2D73_19685 [Acetobacter sacchari]|uniref:Uncharacterized protein n=1 Tax=Acetobacter sacchari TaxID=2661687 RepID=A0ABS3M1K1_9PROT|nr:hypothetical protein [Acetobacter sacchari]MBO1362007.1 hypothetical protein [Acetobacter sacchari]
MTSKFSIPNPLNDTQRRFNELCEMGGGSRGGPARTKVQELLKQSGDVLNIGAERYAANCLKEFSDLNPWHVCFAIGISWGHLAQSLFGKSV